MDTAANTDSNFAQSQQAGVTGFAIPINHAITIANQIANGHASATVHLGLAGFIGINVADASAGCQDQTGFGITSPVGSGALICQVFPGTPAASAGLVQGDVITSLNGQSVGSSKALTSLMASDHPGDQLSIGYIDGNGIRHTTIVTLTAMAK
jgi:S1-C subfamily serine protease